MINEMSLPCFSANMYDCLFRPYTCRLSVLPHGDTFGIPYSCMSTLWNHVLSKAVFWIMVRKSVPFCDKWWLQITTNIFLRCFSFSKIIYSDFMNRSLLFRKKNMYRLRLQILCHDLLFRSFIIPWKEGFAGWRKKWQNKWRYNVMKENICDYDIRRRETEIICLF